MATDESSQGKQGPKGGRKHQPGRGHARKSEPLKKRRFARKAQRKQIETEEEAKKLWREWGALPDDVKKLLGPVGLPTMPRPKDD